MAEQYEPQYDPFLEGTQIDEEAFFANGPSLDDYGDEIFNDVYSENQYLDPEMDGGLIHQPPMQEAEINPETGDEAYYIPSPPVDLMLDRFELPPLKYPLDPQQEQGASHEKGPAILIAGAGSGKTTVIIENAARKLAAGYSPHGFVMVTFTKKAASEMKSRLLERIGFDAGVEPTTFHSFFYKVLTRAPKRFNLPDGFTVMDDKAQIKSFDLVLDNDEVQINREIFPSSQWKSGYSYCKNECLRAQQDMDVMQQIIGHMRDFLKPTDGITEISDYEIANALLVYEQFTHENGMLDHDDLILKPLEVFRRDPYIAEQYSKQINQLIVDETQDTNLSQYLLIKILGSYHKNVIIVGDDDQSIYGWRGARVENMRHFINDFNAKQYLIESNYRCAPVIVEKATNFVRNNSDRIEKNPKAMGRHNTAGEVNMVTADNSYDMTKDLIGRIKMAIQSGIPADEIAILYRGKTMLSVIEGDLIKSGIPYNVAGTSKLMERKETKLLVAIARLVMNNHDYGALDVVCEILPGVGSKAVSEVITASDKTKKPLLSDDCIGYLRQKKAKESLLTLRELINELRQTTPDKWVPLAKEKLGILEHYKDKNKKDPVKFSRIEANIQQLQMWSENLGIENWHELFEILLEQEDPERTEEKAVTLTTIHKAKGLEYQHVHIVGLSKGLFPVDRSAGEDNDIDMDGEAIQTLQEERRVFYVALTRASKAAFCYHANKYNIMPNRFFSLSPFIGEMTFSHHFKIKPAKPQYNNNKPAWNRYNRGTR